MHAARQSAGWLASLGIITVPVLLARKQACVVTGGKLRRVPGEYSAPPSLAVPWRQGAGRDFLAPDRRGRARPAAVHYQNSTATIMGSYKEAAVRSRGKRWLAQAQEQDERPVLSPALALSLAGKARAARSPSRRGCCTDAIMRVAHHHATQAQRSRPPEREREREREKTIEPRATSPRIGFAKKSCDRRFARRAWCTGVASITSLFELVPRPASFVRSFRRLGPRIGAPPGRTTGSSEKKTISC